MKTIYKYILEPIGGLAIQMPVGAKILTVQGQNDRICIWAEVNSDSPTEEVIFEVFGTGHKLPNGMGVNREYIGTVQVCDGSLVLHVYRLTGI